jgi:threonine/homoserine/homoserine lactone efflux protein
MLFGGDDLGASCYKEAVLIAFLKGCAIGLSIAAPVGPIGVLCIRRSLAHGPKTGFFTGLGAAAADAIYGGVAAFGLTAISGFLVEQELWLRLVGGIFLFYLGAKTFLSKPALQPATASTDAGAFTSTLFLTLTNPMTIFSFLAIFAGIGFGAQSNSLTSASLLTLGVFLGSAAWWLLLSNGAALLRTRITPAWMQAVNRFSGLIILVFAITALWPLRLKLF